jgi:hypothetical protein
MEFDPRVKWSAKGENVNTLFINNAADSYFNVSGQLAGHNTNDYSGAIRRQLASPTTFDFRPQLATALAQCRAGAYSTNNGAYWIPGRQAAPVHVPHPPSLLVPTA